MRKVNSTANVVLNDEQQKRFNKIYRVEDRSQFLPLFLIFVSIFLLLLVVFIMEKIGVSRSTTAIVKLIMYTDGFIFILLFLKNWLKNSNNSRVLPYNYNIVSAYGLLVSSSLNYNFLYILQDNEKIPLEVYHSKNIVFDQYGCATLIEYREGEYILFEFDVVDNEQNDDVLS